MKLLFIGDIVGSIGRRTIEKILPKLRKSLDLDLVIANSDNLAHGNGVNAKSLDEAVAAGVDVFTNGDHAFDKVKQLGCYDEYPNLLRPANYSPNAVGRGYDIFKVGRSRVAVINLLGRIFMQKQHECPFFKIDEILAELSLNKQKISAIIIDMHAEATSEKICLKHYVDGRVSAVIGTHTHVMTADENISDSGTAFLSDAGMTGAYNEALGVEKDNIIKTFLTQVRYPHIIPGSGKTIFNGVLLEIDNRNGKATKIKTIKKIVTIKKTERY